MKEYYLGLDIGTNSVGWAVTDNQYNIVKYHGKSLWGTHQFPEGTTAAERRIHRGARRRRMRQTQRIKLLQELFATEISNIDPLFFERLADSKYYPDDKDIKQPYALFNDTGYTDKQYHKQYPTIFHLRNTLIKEDRKYELRLIYLAVHHIMKNRGHFLFAGQSMQEISELQPVFNQLTQYLEENMELNYSCPGDTLKQVADILKSRKLGIRAKQTALNKILPSAQKQQNNITSLITGGSVSIKDLFNLNEDVRDENDKPYKISFKNDIYEEKRDKLVAILGENIELIDNAKAVYDWALLADILQGKDYISEAQILKYEKHQRDLKILKSIVKDRLTMDNYKNIFLYKPGKNSHNYASYIGIVKIKESTPGKFYVKVKKSTQNELCESLSKIITEKTCGSHPDFIYVSEELENRTFLPKPISAVNSVIPYQLHLRELGIILNNAAKHYDFLNQVDDTGLTIKEKIIELFKFRIPYYVGPLNDAHKNKGGNCWIVKRPGMDGISIRPWNFEDIVDRQASRDEFITRMTNNCTYLIGEKVLPKNSLLYGQYMVLNELNNLTVGDAKISPAVKQKIFQELYMKQRTVNIVQLKQFLINEGIIDKTTVITGFAENLKNNLSSYNDFVNILGEKMEFNMVEDIIRCFTICGKDKNLVQDYIKDKYGLDKNSIDKILALNYTGWGRFSKKFLKEINHINPDGSVMNIISGLIKTEDNLMQLLSSKYNYTKRIEEANAELACLTETLDDKINQINLSPAVKRSLYRTLKIVDEIVHTTQGQPKKIFLEMARGEGEKKATKSRKELLLELYKKCKDEERDWIREIQDKPASDFNSKRLYLYYTQMGTCMYTGKEITLADLYNTALYDIDHIYPQSKRKDDSIDNLVLVNKTFNEYIKSDNYPLQPETQQKNKDHWDRLLSMELISKEKHYRLTRKTEFSEDELADFIARQLVETRQSSKAVAHILKQIYPDSKIVYVKSGNVSEFRQKMGLIKVREVNDFHHAKDAYLSIVVGNIYDTKFTSNPYNFIKSKEIRQPYHLSEIYKHDVRRNGVTAWQSGHDGTIKQVRKYMRKNNILVTKYPYEEKGTLFNATLVRKPNILSLKKDDRLKDTGKYGGYEGIKTAYYMYVDYSKNETTRARKLVAVPVHIASQSEFNLIRYCEQKGLRDPKILIPKIKLNTLFNFDGFCIYLTGYNNDNSFKAHHAHQLCIGEENELYIRKTTKYIDKIGRELSSLKKHIENQIKEEESLGKVFEEEERKRHIESELDKETDNLLTSDDGVTREDNLMIYNQFIHKLDNTIYKIRLSEQANTLKSKREIFVGYSVYKQCKIIMEILHLFQCKSNFATLTLLQGAKEAGKLAPSSNIVEYNLPSAKNPTIQPKSAYNYASIIYQSPCGIYTHEVDLLKI